MLVLVTKSNIGKLSHPAKPYMIATWFGDLLYSMQWMKAEGMKLRELVLRDNIDSQRFRRRYLGMLMVKVMPWCVAVMILA